MMVAPRLLSGLFGALFTFYTAAAAAAAGLAIGSLDISLVFPLNDTYAPQDGPLPIVFRLSSQPFQPTLASTLQLRLTYLLLDSLNGSHRVAYNDLDLGKLSNSTGSVDNPYFFIGYSDKLAGRESLFELQVVINAMIGIRHNSTTIVTDAGFVISAYFTLQSGAKAAEVPNSASNGNICLSHGGWRMTFDVSDYIESKSGTYALMTPDSPSFGPVGCAVEVDGATAANITAGLAAATATTTPASSNSPGAGTSTAGSSSGSAVAAAVWSLLMLGLSVVLFLC
ncbi:hypothetical protein CONLIGDRAFT_28366 [Coniochaeta ligniaria NRRL 30616]|uniref:DUF7136 domain-containing protein n=1 Tax=Coniochaeta ligniaria NRRL 30616 TaxID=1408157 RepID=A0A1J7J5W8_9PEZI|nr:hypothetical protein CONLIGDRAFT_28366 [Coniochaeta ligniaria NRRL 30616]